MQNDYRKDMKGVWEEMEKGLEKMEKSNCKKMGNIGTWE